jgi:hypothetical protein
MQDKEPLKFEEIAEYLEQPEAAAHTQYRRRLLASPLSRERADRAWRIQQTLREDPQSVIPEIGDETALTPAMREELQSLRDGTLNEERRASLRERLQADPRLLREALHYSVGEGAPREHAASVRKPIGAWLAQLSAWRVPAWAAAGTAAALVLAVVLITPSGVSEEGGLRLAAYRDDPVIRFAAQDTLPGLGFFADAQTETQPFADVSVQLRGNELVMDWPEVAGARGYTVQLLVTEQGRQREVAKVETAASSAVIGEIKPVTGRRYVWVISGTAAGQRKFATRGGFVLQ